MPKRVALICLAAGLCTGMTCTIEFPEPGGPAGGTGAYVPLDQASALITIRQSHDNNQAEVEARIHDRFGWTVWLQRGQALSINALPLVGPDHDGAYRRTVAVAATYTVTVAEPTRGVLDTMIAAPGGFEIIAPAAGQTVSLSGFPVSWSNPDPALSVTLTLSQTIFGEDTTRTFGPFTDTGVQTFDDQHLLDFRQGAELAITVTRTNTALAIAGFMSGTLSVEHAATVLAWPGQ